MRMIEKLAQLTRKEVEEAEKGEKKQTEHFRTMARRPQAALGSQRAQAVLGALGGGTLAHALARKAKGARIPLAILGAMGGGMAAGGAGMIPTLSRREAAKKFPYEDWSKVKTKD